MQRGDNYNGVLYVIQCDTVINTASCCKQITIVNYCIIYNALLSPVLTAQYWKFCNKHFIE